MLFAFIDESYTKDRYYVAAYVVPEAGLGAIGDGIANAKSYAEGFGVEPGAEMHAHEMMSGKGMWRALRGKHRAAVSIYGRALQEIIAVPGARMFIEGVDIPRLNARYRYPDPPHRLTLRHLLEAVDAYALKIGEEVLVIADEVQDQTAHAARAANYQLVGTGGYKSSKLTTIQMPITFGSSDQSPGLQAADLIVYLFRRHDAHTETNRKAEKSVQELWAALRPIWQNVRRWDP